MNTPQKKTVNFEAAAEKIQRYCAYQERCQNDVRQKLREWQIETKKAEQLIKELVSEDFVNDERFAKAFARGKFKIKSWGIAKITNELKRRNISGDCIAQALKEIDADAYKETLQKLAKQWLSKQKAETEFIRNQKLFRYLLSKGYKTDEVWDFVNNYD
jgi:regulatory protein